MAGTTDNAPITRAQAWKYIGFFLFVSTMLTLTILAGMGPVPTLLLAIVAIATVLAILYNFEWLLSDRQEFQCLISLVGLAAFVGLVTCGVYALAVGGDRTEATSFICTFIVVIALMALVITEFTAGRSHSDRQCERAR